MTEMDYYRSIKMAANEGMRLRHQQLNEEVEKTSSEIKSRNAKMSETDKRIQKDLDEIDDLFTDLGI